MDETTQMTPRVLALVGMPGAGKSMCAVHLQAKGFFQYRFGGIIVGEVARRGLPLTPDTERLVREELRAVDGMAAIAMRALPILHEALESHSHIIIDGLYSFSEYKFLRSALGTGMVVVAVIADRALRYARLGERAERPLTPDEAEARDVQEIERLEKGGPIAIADYTLLNNGDQAALYAALDALMLTLGFVPRQLGQRA